MVGFEINKTKTLTIDFILFPIVIVNSISNLDGNLKRSFEWFELDNNISNLLANFHCEIINCYLITALLKANPA